MRNFFSHNEPLAIVFIAVAIAAGLFTFEYSTGLSASVRSDPTYNTLSLPLFRPLRKAARPSMRDQRKAKRMKASSSSSVRR